MQALLGQKAFVLRSLDSARLDAKRLTHARTGLFVKPESFCLMKLAKILQELAAAKLKELRLLSFVSMIEEKMRFHARSKVEGAISIGSAPAHTPRAKKGMTGMEAFAITFYALRLQR